MLRELFHENERSTFRGTAGFAQRSGAFAFDEWRRRSRRVLSEHQSSHRFISIHGNLN